MRKQLLPVMGSAAILVTVGGWITSAEAFTIRGTSGYFDDVTLQNGNFVTSENPYDKVEFLTDVGGTGENQVRWGTAKYGTQVTTQEWVEGEWVDQGHWAENGGFWRHGSYGKWDYSQQWVEERTTVAGYTSSYSNALHWHQKPNYSASCVSWYWNGNCSNYKVTKTTGGFFEDVKEWRDIAWVDTSYQEEGYWEEVTETVFTYENKSGLGFDGVEALPITVGQSFEIGTLTHFNQTIKGDDLAGIKAGFELLLDLGDEIGQKAFNFDLHIDETNNDAHAHAGDVCPYQTDAGKGCSDQITWDFALADQQTFTDSNGQEYTLELVGFSPNGDVANTTQAFVSQEKQNSEASLWAKIVAVGEPPAEQVPEPSALLGLGLVMVGAFKMKKNRQRPTEGFTAGIQPEGLVPRFA